MVIAPSGGGKEKSHLWNKNRMRLNKESLWGTWGIGNVKAQHSHTEPMSTALCILCATPAEGRALLSWTQVPELVSKSLATFETSKGMEDVHRPERKR